VGDVERSLKIVEDALFLAPNIIVEIEGGVAPERLDCDASIALLASD